MIKRFSVFILTLFLLVGCASVPDEVKEDMSNYNDSSFSDDGTSFSYVEVSELQSNTEEALKESYGQFTISDKINFVKPDEINVMKFSIISNFNENSEKIIPFFLINLLLTLN